MKRFFLGRNYSYSLLEIAGFLVLLYLLAREAYVLGVFTCLATSIITEWVNRNETRD